MAKARVSYRFTTGESVAVVVAADAEHPDALDQIAARARTLFAEVVEDLKLEDAEQDEGQQ